MSKYDPDGPFQDPVLRCDSCTKIVKTDEVCELGMCPECGNRRMRNVVLMTPAEHEQVVGMGVDPAFMARFQAVAHE